MIRHVAVAVLLASSTVFANGSVEQGRQNAPAATTAVPAALKPLQGTWVLTTPDGQPLTSAGDLTLVITGDKYAQAIGGTVNERGTIKLDTTKKPTWIDLTITEGTDTGKLQIGLIEVAAGVMKGVLGQAGGTTRPASLAPAPGVISFVGKKKP